ncbi:MAG: histidine phosphatase family protein [Clostridia bacterium]|nr:histidine phosphatase family protein [Clostridia bacterium]
MKLYVIRHGQSEYNLKRCHTGWAQVSLTPKGFEEAKSISGFLSKYQFDKIYTSDLLRAKQTAETALPGCVYEEDARLREIHMGEIAGKTAEECHELFGDLYVEEKTKLNFVPFGGENAEMLRARAQSFLDMLTERKDACVAAFAHAGILRSILECALETTLWRKNIKCDNCTIAVFEYEDNKWYFYGWISPQELS